MHDHAERPITVGLVGLGIIGRIHLDVLIRHPRASVTFIADPAIQDRERPTSHGVQRISDLSAALDHIERGFLAEPDLIVLATPTSEHLIMAAEVLSRTNATVLSEKPLSASVDALARFERDHPLADRRLHVVNHFAFSPEVEWAAAHVAQHGWGSPQRALSTFNDPYVKKSEGQRDTYVSSWVDSAPNQLGLLARFASGFSTRCHTSADAMRSITEIDFDGGSAVLLSNWMTGDSSKQTSLRWTGGRELLLDHTAMTGLALMDARPGAHFGNDGALDRKTAHYSAMYNHLLTVQATPLLSMDLARSIAGVLHAGATAGALDRVEWDIVNL
jgi:hypothetical protein